TPIGSKIAYPTAGLASADVAGPDVRPGEVSALLNRLTSGETRLLKPVMTNGRPGFEIFHDVLAPAVLEWRRFFQSQVGAAEVAGRPLQPSTVSFSLKARPDLYIGYKTGALDHIKDVDVWVNGESTDMMMDRFLGRSISGRIRYLGAKK